MWMHAVKERIKYGDAIIIIPRPKHSKASFTSASRNLMFGSVMGKNGVSVILEVFSALLGDSERAILGTFKNFPKFQEETRFSICS